MKKIILIGFVLLGIVTVKSQAQNIGINNTDPKAALDVNGGFRLRSENTTVTGPSVLLTTNRSHHVLIGSPVADFNIAFIGATENGQHAIITNTTLRKGFLVPIYIQPNSTVELIYSNGAWKLIGTTEPVSSTAWGLTGNAGTDTSVNFIGTTDDKPLKFKVNNQPAGLIDANTRNTVLGTNAHAKLNDYSNASANVAIGANALSNDTSGNGNTAVGYYAMEGTKTSGSQNTAIGSYTLQKVQGFQNSAFGSSAMAFLRTGNFNTTVGAYAYANTTSGTGNTAVGVQSMYGGGSITSISGNYNTAVGMLSLKNNIIGNGAVAIGHQAAFSDTAAEGIVAIGRAALYNSLNRRGNIAIGDSAMFNNGIDAISNADGSKNTAIGNHALFANKTGYSNTSVGNYSMYTNETGTANTAIGSGAFAFNVSGGSNTVVGETALYQNTIGFHNTALGTQSLYQNIAGNQNVAVGGNSLYNNKNGNGGVAIGYAALFKDSAANGTIAIGRAALYNNINKTGNIAIGDSALFANGPATVAGASKDNIGIGSKALLNNTKGSNIAIGTNALVKNDGWQNTAIGNYVMQNCLDCSYNIALGPAMTSSKSGYWNIALGLALSKNNGQHNIAMGNQSMFNDSTGNNNIGIGQNTLRETNGGNNNIAIGEASGSANITGSSNVFIGQNSGTTAKSSSKLYIGSYRPFTHLFDSLNTLIYGDFAADSVLLNAKTVVRNNAVVRGFTKLGGYGTDVPSVKMKKITGVNGAAGITTPFLHGLTQSKILSVSILINASTSNDIPPRSTYTGFEYDYYVSPTNIFIKNIIGNDGSITNRPVRILITYEE